MKDKKYITTDSHEIMFIITTKFYKHYLGDKTIKPKTLWRSYFFPFTHIQINRMYYRIL